MSQDYLNIVLAFMEGLALIISPCILPILPIILAGSLSGSKKRPLGIILGFVLMFTALTFFSRAVVLYTHINLSLVRYFSYAFLLLFGIIMLSTYLTEKFNLFTQSLTRTGSSLSSVNNPEGGFGSGIIFGGLAGVIWVPCAGPILAAVIVQTVLQTTTLSSFLMVLSFAIGAGVPMLGIALFGRSIMSGFSYVKTHAVMFRKILGAVIIASVAYMMYGEGIPSVSAKSNVTSVEKLINPNMIAYPAPEVSGTAWINSPPLQINQLAGKVVLIDFWTYSCINCLRTLPYLKDWYQKYHDKGLVIIGVHAPEFQFEHDFNNVKTAVKKLGIRYPVALDNNFVTWRNFNNKYWPAHYLIDKDGKVVYQHFGEGEYDTTENNIRYLLGLTGDVNPIVEKRFARHQTPETYLGSRRAANFSSPESITLNKPMTYTFPATLGDDRWALSGTWIVTPEKIIAGQDDAVLKIHFNGAKVFLVMGNTGSRPIKVKLLLNGERVIAGKGSDVIDSAIEVSGHRLYELISLPQSSSGILQVISSAPGLELYAFTFGST